MDRRSIGLAAEFGQNAKQVLISVTDVIANI